MHALYPHVRITSMAEYLSLFFQSDYANHPVLKEWITREGQTLNKGDPLFIYGEGATQKHFYSSVSGTFKTFLCKEGETLIPGISVAVLQVSAEIAAESVKNGLGKTISPEEAKKGMSYAEAASIRHPTGGLPG